MSQIVIRILLFAILFPTGMHAIFGHEVFSPEDARRIEAMGSVAAPFERLVETADPVSWGAVRRANLEDGPTFRALNRYALWLEDAGAPQPLPMAWAMAVVQLVGGAAMLLGLLGRLLALPVAAAGAVHLWCGTWPQVEGMWPWQWMPDDAEMVTAWLAATLLPLVVLLAGTGPFSLGQLLGGSRSKPAKGAQAP
ncbi:MAG: hypothetical protein RLZZ558_817 [Planctomycetota bacterium]|jgi:uncharacterized membrane protein YphA (DoxX/SURF4 family)